MCVCLCVYMQEVKKKVEAIDGLETLMSSLGLEDKLPDAANWCQVNGAKSVRDIHEADCAEQLAKDLGLPLVKANKLIKAIKELGTAGAHLDISAAEQAIKHESEILSILKDHKAKRRMIGITLSSLPATSAHSIFAHVMIFSCAE